jgi:hypothetical protein
MGKWIRIGMCSHRSTHVSRGVADACVELPHDEASTPSVKINAARMPRECNGPLLRTTRKLCSIDHASPSITAAGRLGVVFAIPRVASTTIAVWLVSDIARGDSLERAAGSRPRSSGANGVVTLARAPR